MSVVPTNYTVGAITTLVSAVDNDETRAQTARVETYGAIISSEDPAVSPEAKMAAINALRTMGATSRAMGAQDALIKATWYVSESPFAKEMDAAGSRFSAEMMSAGRSMQARGDGEPNAGQMNLDALNRRSEQEQTLIAYNMGYSSLSGWKDALQQQADDYAARNPAPAVKIALSDEAKATLAQSGAATALETLARGADPTGKGAAALSILRNAAEARRARTAEREEQAQAEPAPRKPQPRSAYIVGDALDRSV